jgi:hypothetical protein
VLLIDEKKMGRDVAMSKAKRVTTYCKSCDGEPPMGLKCFNKKHKK